MADAAPAAPTRSLFGHPLGLMNLFFTEAFERFSYYGLRAMLILYLGDAVMNHRGGLALSDRQAAGIYALYVGFVYLLALPGGWIADRLIGQQRSVFWGAILIAAGQFSLAVPLGGLPFAVLGLVLIVLGTGLLKPNVSVIVGQLYPEGGVRRDAGFSIFYSGINLGAFVAPLPVSYVAETYNWHWGYLLCGCVMLCGAFWFRSTKHWLAGAGSQPSRSGDAARDSRIQRRGWTAVAVSMGLLAFLGAALWRGWLSFDVNTAADYTGWGIFTAAVLFFAYILIFGGLTTVEKKRVVVIFLLFAGAALFWTGFEQAGSSLNIFGERYTDRDVLGYVFPAGWFQSVQPFFIITLSPFVGYLWIRLAAKNLNPSTPMKFAFGLILMAAGFLVMVGAARVVAHGALATPYWLVVTYFFHTVGELCLSPVGLSAVTKLAPPRYVSQMMGTFFMGLSLGNVFAGLMGGKLDPSQLSQMPDVFMQIVYLGVGAGLVFLVFTPPIRKLIGGAE
ncbi:MAG TPA: peptide MFS transporter [Gammaproteobacteria bacterium]|nr:peptide MFS transporter [Gammaproteobacteria bacterium]